LEAGCINTGLSSLQIIFNELRVKGKLSKMLGNGLRRVLHPYINTRTILAVIFTFSPSVNNAKPTESTLKFAVTAGMVKVQPLKAEVSLNVEKLVQNLRKHIAENEKLIEEQENNIMAKNADLEVLKQELMVAGGDYDSVQKQDAQDMADMGFKDAAYVASGNKMKGKDVSHLQKSVLDKLAYLDEDSDDAFGDLDDMFATNNVDDEYEKQLEKELNAAFKADKKGKGAAKLLKDAVGVEYDEKADIDIENLEAELEDTLIMGDMDIDDIGAQQAAMDEINADAIQLDFKNMTVDDVAAHVEETWVDIEDNKAQQNDLKKAQENVVGHLVETNEWLFAALQETLQSQEVTTASAQLSSRKLL